MPTAGADASMKVYGPSSEDAKSGVVLQPRSACEPFIWKERLAVAKFTIEFLARDISCFDSLPWYMREVDTVR